MSAREERNRATKLAADAILALAIARRDELNIFIKILCNAINNKDLLFDYDDWLRAELQHESATVSHKPP